MARINKSNKSYADFRRLIEDGLDNVDNHDAAQGLIFKVAAAYALEYLDDDQLNEILCNHVLAEKADFEDLTDKAKYDFAYQNAAGALVDWKVYREASKENRKSMKPYLKIKFSLVSSKTCTLGEAKAFASAFWTLMDEILDEGLESGNGVTTRGGKIHIGTDLNEYAKLCVARVEDPIERSCGYTFLQLAYDFSPEAIAAMEEEIGPSETYKVFLEYDKLFDAARRHVKNYLNKWAYGGDPDEYSKLKKKTEDASILDLIVRPEVAGDEKQAEAIESMIARWRGGGFKEGEIIGFLKNSSRTEEAYKEAERLQTEAREKAKAEKEAKEKADEEAKKKEGSGEPDSSGGSDEEDSGEGGNGPVPVTGPEGEDQQVDDVYAKIPTFSVDYWLLSLSKNGVKPKVDWFDGQPKKLNIVDIMTIMSNKGVQTTDGIDKMFEEAIASAIQAEGDGDQS